MVVTLMFNEGTSMSGVNGHTLAEHIELSADKFDIDLSGDIDISSLMQVSKLNLSFLATSDNLNDYIGDKVHPTTQEFNDFDVLGKSVESANISNARDVREEVFTAEQEKEKELKEQQDNFVAVLAIIQENLRPEDVEFQTWNVGGQDWQVSNAGIQATIARIEHDLDGMAEEYGLDEQQKQDLVDLKDELKGKSAEEQQAILDRVAKENPALAKAFMNDAENQSAELKSEFMHKTQAKVANDVTVTASDSFDDFSSAPILSANFNPNAIGEVPVVDGQIAKVEPSVEYGLG